MMEIAVVGAHLSGLPLNGQLTSRGGVMIRTAVTAADYKLVKLAGGPPFRPGLIRMPKGQGASIALEVWALPQAEVGSFLGWHPFAARTRNGCALRWIKRQGLHL